MDTIQSISLSILGGMWTLIVWTWWIIVPIIIYFARKNIKKAEYVINTNHKVISVKIPKNNEKGPIAAEMMFASLHGILQPEKLRKSGEVVQEHLSFEIVSTVNAIEFFVWMPENLRDFVEGQIYAQYPTAEIAEVNDYSKDIDIDDDNEDDCIAGAELSLVKDEIYPIKTFQNFDVDPLAGITGMLSKIEGQHEKVWIQFLAKPIDDSWRDGSLGHIEYKKSGKQPTNLTHKAIDMLGNMINSIPNMVNGLLTSEEQAKKDKEKAEKEKKKKEKEAEKGVQLSHAVQTELTAIEEKANKLGYKVMVRVVYLAKTKEKASERVQAAFGAFKQFNTTNLNGFKMGQVYTGNDFLNAYRARLFDESGFILNIEELASLFHLPHVSVETPNIVWTSSKKGEPPANLPIVTEEMSADDITPLGLTTFRGQNKVFGIKRDDRRRHIYIIGKSGTGKSKLLESLAIKDIRNGEGMAFVDPHGDSAETLLKFIPKERIDDVIYFNPADREFPIAFNPLEARPDQREEVANGFVSVLKKLFGFSWGPRLEYVLKHTVLALVEVEGSTMLGIVRMLTDKNYRKKIVGEVTDPVVQMFWLKEFSTYNDKMATETVAPILNKVGQFTSSPIIRNIVGQSVSNFDFASAMNDGKILIFNLSTGLIGEENAKLLGSMVVTKLQLAAMSRAAIPEEQRRDFYLYVDEFQNFATDSFAVILSEARKYRLSLTVANQYIAQMDETVRDAVFGNVGTLISFRVGATDAAALEKEFAPIFEQNDLINLDNQHIYLTMLIEGVSSMPFSAMTIRRPDVEEDNSPAVIAVSRMKFGTPKNQVEEDVRRWYNVDSVIAGVNANEKDSPIKSSNNTNSTKPLNSQIKEILEEKDDDNDKDPKNDQKPPKENNKKPKKEEKTQNLGEIIAKATQDGNKDEERKNVLKFLRENADYIVRHKDGDNKYVFLPDNKPDFVVPDEKGRVKGSNYKKNGKKIYQVKINMFEPKNRELFGKNNAPDIWIGTPEEMVAQLDAISEGLGGGSKFIGIEDKTKNQEALKAILNKNKGKSEGSLSETEKKDITEPKVEAKKTETVETVNNEQKPELTPAKAPETIKKEEVEIPEVVDKEVVTKLIHDITTPLSKLKPAGESDKEPEVENVENINIVPENEPVEPFYPSEKKIKEITPEEFHNMKAIHPHEKVKIKESETRELKPGETITFSK